MRYQQQKATEECQSWQRTFCAATPCAAQGSWCGLIALAFASKCMISSWSTQNRRVACPTLEFCFQEICWKIAELLCCQATACKSFLHVPQRINLFMWYGQQCVHQNEDVLIISKKCNLTVWNGIRDVGSMSKFVSATESAAVVMMWGIPTIWILSWRRPACARFGALYHKSTNEYESAFWLDLVVDLVSVRKFRRSFRSEKDYASASR